MRLLSGLKLAQAGSGTGKVLRRKPWKVPRTGGGTRLVYLTFGYVPRTGTLKRRFKVNFKAAEFPLVIVGTGTNAEHLTLRI